VVDELVLTDALERLGKYTLVERIGSGGMAEVYLAEQEDIAGVKKTVVVKRILAHLAKDAHFNDMFLREARLAASLHHAHIVQLLDFAEDRGTYFIAMEHVDGLTLDRLASTAWHKKMSLPLELVCVAMAEAALGLHHAHMRSLVHRDITPENIMMNREGVTKILDFGIAKPLDDKARQMTQQGELKGKLRFLSPEQLSGERVDARSDVYSLGVTMYWLLTGVPPFDGVSDLEIMDDVLYGDAAPPATINPAVPREINALVLRMLAKKASDRPSTAEEIHDVLSFAIAARTKVVLPFLREIFAAGVVDKKPPKDLRDLRASVARTDIFSAIDSDVSQQPRPELDGVTVDEMRLPVKTDLSSENVFASDPAGDATVPIRGRSQKRAAASDVTLVQRQPESAEITAEQEFIEISLSEESKPKKR
jgi:serine/threonine protein kinase